MNKTIDEILTTLLITGVILIVIGFAIIQPYMEMKIFNDCTGSNATLMDAIFGELRATECNK